MRSVVALADMSNRPHAGALMDLDRLYPDYGVRIGNDYDRKADTLTLIVKGSESKRMLRSAVADSLRDHVSQQVDAKIAITRQPGGVELANNLGMLHTDFPYEGLVDTGLVAKESILRTIGVINDSINIHANRVTQYFIENPRLSNLRWTTATIAALITGLLGGVIQPDSVPLIERLLPMGISALFGGGGGWFGAFSAQRVSVARAVTNLRSYENFSDPAIASLKSYHNTLLLTGNELENRIAAIKD